MESYDKTSYQTPTPPGLYFHVELFRSPNQSQAEINSEAFDIPIFFQQTPWKPLSAEREPAPLISRDFTYSEDSVYLLSQVTWQLS